MFNFKIFINLNSLSLSFLILNWGYSFKDDFASIFYLINIQWQDKEGIV